MLMWQWLCSDTTWAANCVTASRHGLLRAISFDDGIPVSHTEEMLVRGVGNQLHEVTAQPYGYTFRDIEYNEPEFANSMYMLSHL